MKKRYSPSINEWVQSLPHCPVIQWHRGDKSEYPARQNGQISPPLKRGALVNAKDNHNKTPILIANKGGYSEVLKQLLPRGAGVNSTDDRGLSPLH